MGDQITREEMQAWAEANKEAAAALSKLTSLVEGNSKKLDSIAESKDGIIDSIVGRSDDGSTTTLMAIKNDTSSTRDNINKTMFIVSSIVIIATAAAVVANIVFRELQDTKIMKTIASKQLVQQSEIDKYVSGECK